MRAIPTLLLALVTALACAPKRPVLYPTARYEQVGEDGARRDIDACLALARTAGHSANPAGAAGASTTRDAAAGAAAGAAGGAIWGRAGAGAATGAAAGGARGLVRGLFRWRDPDPIQARYVQACLADRGYRVIGWK
jgi:hypothetical protein